jgi:hypothetical protein
MGTLIRTPEQWAVAAREVAKLSDDEPDLSKLRRLTADSVSYPQLVHFSTIMQAQTRRTGHGDRG